MTNRQSTLTGRDVNRPGRSNPDESSWSHARQGGSLGDAYRDKGSEGVSWYQPEPVTALDLVRRVDVPPSRAVSDIGGGTSFLVDRLVEPGFTDLRVLDVSEVALDQCRRRLNDDPGGHAHTRRRRYLAAMTSFRAANLGKHFGIGKDTVARALRRAGVGLGPRAERVEDGSTEETLAV